ncbi:hypothetical protein THRCLA_11379, partial [Thraustotheca clavata]
VGENCYGAWLHLFAQYEMQQIQLFNETANDDILASSNGGSGKLAHELWKTEERVRMLVREEAFCKHMPEDLHGKLWLILSGANLEMQQNPGLYHNLLANDPINGEAVRQIDADIHRTIGPEETDWSDQHTQKLRNVLVAYASHNPTLGYCQGLNYVVARLLQCVGGYEEASFWLLDRMIAMLPDDYYTTMLGVAVDQHVFAFLVSQQKPDIIRHIESLGGLGSELSLACTEWFLTLFASPCKKDITMRVWDLFFINGSEVLFRVALAMMHIEHANIIHCHYYADVLTCLNQMGRDTNIDPNTLLRLAQEQDIPMMAIEDLRVMHRLELASGIASSVAPNAKESNETPRTSISGPAPSPVKRRKHRNRHQQDPLLSARSIPRHLSQEDIEEDEEETTTYFSGAPPKIVEYYWKPDDGFAFPQYFDDDPPSTAHDWRRRQRQYSDMGTIGRRSLEQSKTSSFRENRSKSTADDLRSIFGHDHHNERPEKGLGVIFKRLEEWGRDLKAAKERKKQEKAQRQPKIVEDTFEDDSVYPPPPPPGSFELLIKPTKLEPKPTKSEAFQMIQEQFAIQSQIQDQLARCNFSPRKSSPPTTLSTGPATTQRPLSGERTRRMVSSRSTPSLLTLEIPLEDAEDDFTQRQRSGTTTKVLPPRYHVTPATHAENSHVNGTPKTKLVKRHVPLLSIDSTVEPPDMRRHTSLPVSARQVQSLNARQMNQENARLLRDRANVVNYLHRKASDVSSITSLSAAGSPASESEMVWRGSMSSDEGRRVRAQRTNSFSFLERLSIDLGNSLLDSTGSLNEHASLLEC